MKIAIIGSGNVGQALGIGWAKAGYAVVFGSRTPDSEKMRAVLAVCEGRGTAALSKTAVVDADVVALATPWTVTEAVVGSLGDLTGKIVIDCTNPIGPGFQLALGQMTSGGEAVAEWATGARVVKAFNNTGAENMHDPVYNGEATTMFICGDDTEAKGVVTMLAEVLGFAVADVGDLQTARYLEPLAMVWIHLAIVQGKGRNIAFRLVER